MPPPRSARLRSRAPETNCADCSRSPTCWGDPIPTRDGFSVRREAPLSHGDVLCRQGERFEALYVVTQGCVCLRETLREGAERIVAFRAPGEIVGIEGWARGAHPYSAEAIGDVTVCRLVLPRAVHGNALLHRLLLAKTAAHLDHSTRPWAGLPSVDRVAEFVADYARRSGQRTGTLVDIELPMTRAQIGLHLGLAEETVVRAMRGLKAPKVS